MADPGFWGDQAKAQKILQRRKRLESDLALVRKLNSQQDDAQVLADWLEGGEDVAADFTAALGALEATAEDAPPSARKNAPRIDMNAASDPAMPSIPSMKLKRLSTQTMPMAPNGLSRSRPPPNISIQPKPLIMPASTAAMVLIRTSRCLTWDSSWASTP